jgi:hypothetical protein
MRKLACMSLPVLPARTAHALLRRSLLAMLARRQRRCKPDRFTA